MTRHAGLALAAALTLCGPALAQADFDDVHIEARHLRGPVYMLTGRGGNLAVSAGAQGVFLVDDQFAPLTPRIEAAIRAIRDEPVRFVLNTHFHGDHTGGNENLGKEGAVIVAQAGVRRRMGTEQVSKLLGRTTPPAPEVALPVLTFESELTFHVNGEDVHVFHVPAAHTDGDAVVHFLGSDAIHTGDVFFHGTYPFIDVESGGSIEGMIEAEEVVLELAGPETLIVPGHGALADRGDLQAAHDMLVTVRDRVRAALAEGTSLDDFLAGKPLADLDPQWGGGFVGAERFLRIVWADLSRRGTP
jgi:cyclase